MRPDDAACALCVQARGGAENNLISTLVDEAWAIRPVLLESSSIVLMPSVGALVTGHVLVCPVAHHRSVAVMPADVQQELRELAADAQERLEGRLGKAVHRFEHGSSAGSGRVACSVEHAHLHLLAADVDVRPRLRSVAAWREVSGDPQELLAASAGKEYLSYCAPTGEHWIATTESGFESQMLRRVFAVALGVDDWDWRADPAVDRITATAELFGVCAPVVPAAVEC